MPASSLVLRLGTAFGLQALSALAGPALAAESAPRPLAVALIPGLPEPDTAPRLPHAA